MLVNIGNSLRRDVTVTIWPKRLSESGTMPTIAISRQDASEGNVSRFDCISVNLVPGGWINYDVAQHKVVAQTRGVTVTTRLEED